MKDLWVLSTLLVVLAWMLSKQRSEDGPPLYSYEGVHYYDPKRIVTPFTLKEIQDTVLKARHNGHTIRPLGSGHSWNDLGQSEGIYLSLFKYRGLVKLDKLTRTASFKGGTRLWEINSILAQHDLGLPILPSVSNQTLAGALATGTHGAGANFGNLMSYVTKIQLVTGTGEVLNMSPSTDPKMFPAVGVSVGLLGIITEATLKVEPIFNLRETSETFPLSHCLKTFDTFINSNEHVKLWIEIASGTCVVFSASRTRQPANREPVISQPMTDIRMYAYEALQWFMSIFPCTADFAFKLLFSMNAFPKYQRISISWEVFNIPHYLPSSHREAEVAVPLNKCVNAFEDFIQAKRDLNLHLNHMIEVRAVKKDSFWLSSSYNTDVCHVTVLLYNPSDYAWDLLSKTLFNITSSYGGRPHWGKSFAMNQDQLRNLFPKFDEFMHIRKQLDPDGIFLNDPLKETFGID